MLSPCCAVIRFTITTYPEGKAVAVAMAVDVYEDTDADP